LEGIDGHLSVHIYSGHALILEIRFTGDTFGPCAATSPRVKTLSQVLPFAALKKRLVDGKVKEARALTGRDLALIACKSIKLLDYFGIAGQIGQLGAEKVEDSPCERADADGVGRHGPCQGHSSRRPRKRALFTQQGD